MLFGIPILSLVIWLPIVFGIVVLFTRSDCNAITARVLALIGSLAGFCISLPLYFQFDVGVNGAQFTELAPWIARFNINYHLGIDGISLWFILLNSFTTPLVVIAGWKIIDTKVSQYFSAFLIMSGVINGVFCAQDAILFYVFWEATLVPMFLIIGIWGGPNRVYAAIKFFLYTLLGSLLMLVAFIYLYINSGGSFELEVYNKLPLTLTPQILIFICFLSAFAVKVPMWPVHTWLPDAHVEAPTGGSIVLAAILLKLGAYGFLRFSFPITPDASKELAGLMIALSLIAIVYIGFVALVQSDIKKLIAYSSVAHMGFVTLGFFVFNVYGVEGALVQMISHGFIAAALFFCVGVLYDRMHTRMIADYGGVANKMPIFAAFFMLFTLANAGLPGTSGFVGEFMVISGAMKANFWYAAAAGLTLIFGAAYSLWMYKRVVFGNIGNDRVNKLSDVSAREIVVLSILAIAVLGMGVYPLPFTEVLHGPVNELLHHVQQGKGVMP